MLKDILQYCDRANCQLSISFDIPMNVTVKVHNNQLHNSFSQSLPWDHIYDQQIFDVVKYCIEQTTAGRTSAEELTIRDLIPLVGTEREVYLIGEPGGILGINLADEQVLFLGKRYNSKEYAFLAEWLPFSSFIPGTENTQTQPNFKIY